MGDGQSARRRSVPSRLGSSAGTPGEICLWLTHLSVHRLEVCQELGTTPESGVELDNVIWFY